MTSAVRFRNHSRLFINTAKHRPNHRLLEAQRKTVWQSIGIRSSDQLFNLLPVASHIIDAKGTILEVNRRWLDCLGYSRDEVLGRPITDFIPVDQRPEARERFQVKLNGGKVQNIATRTFMRKDGRQFNAISIDTILHLNGGGAKVALTAVIDFSDYKRRVSRYLAEKTFRGLASGVAHRLNNSSPLIKMALGLLERSIKDEGQLSRIKDIQKVFNNFERLVREMLLYVKLSSGDYPRPDFIIEDATGQALDNCQRYYEEKGVNVAVVRAFKADHPVYASQDLMVIAIQNIVDNAYEAITQKTEFLAAAEESDYLKNNLGFPIPESWSGQIIIMVEERSINERVPVREGDLEPGNYLVVSIIDNGIGIKTRDGQGHMRLHNLSDFFEPFFSERDPAEKNGLGLSWVLSALGQLGGEVSVESEWGSGSTIKLY